MTVRQLDAAGVTDPALRPAPQYVKRVTGGPYDVP